MKKILLLFLFSVYINASAQKCEPCGERTLINFQEIEWLGIQKPEDSVLLNEWNKLKDLWHLVYQRIDQYFQKGSCTFIQQSFKTPTNTKNAKNNKYTIYGIIVQSTSDYYLKLFIQPACSDKVIAETEVRFQMYPFFDIDKIATQMASQLWVAMLDNIYDFEMNERKTKNYGLGGDLGGGYIEIAMDKTLVKGEETQVVLQVVDCDGMLLKNKEISTAGTIGGIFTPAKFTTDSKGKITVKFKMTTDKTAFIKAACETKNVWGCEDLYTGTESVKGLAGAPVKVTITYDQYETKTLKRATLPGIKIKGGEEAETIQMDHKTVLYYFPSQKNLKEGFLVDAHKDEGYYIGLTDKQPDADAKTVFVTESGYFIYSKNVASAQIIGMIGDMEAVQEIEKGSTEGYHGVASLQHPSEVIFHKGSTYEPPSFMWNIEYPANNGIATGGATIVKGDEGVQWKVNKITDPKSLYKTEYLLSVTLNAADELKKGEKAMKGLFGFNLDELAGKLDPTKPQNNIAGASGSQTVKVQILSPYTEEK